MIRIRWVWLLVAVVIVLLLLHGPGRVFKLDLLKSHYAALLAYRLEHPGIAALLYFALYATVTGLSVPGIIILSVTGGAVFGLWWGTLLASFASALGGTLAFLLARRLFRETVRQHWSQQLAKVEAGMAQDGPWYLFGLRLIPVIPYFLINLVMGLTPISTGTFYWVSQLGMLPLLLLYVNAGTQLAQLDSLQDIVSPTLLISLGLIAFFPLLARWLAVWVAHIRHCCKSTKATPVP